MKITTKKENGQTIIMAISESGVVLGEEVCFSNHPMTVSNFEEKLRQRWQYFDESFDLGSLHPVDCGFCPKKIGKAISVEYHPGPVKIKIGPTKSAPEGKVLVAKNSRGLATLLRENGYVVAFYDRDESGLEIPVKKKENGWIGGVAEAK